jgi:hypothetical protein
MSDTDWTTDSGEEDEEATDSDSEPENEPSPHQGEEGQEPI